ncbi:hypothetical protein A5819_003596 [Enterococcus sp. 7E2_DIV0204]|nr:hypothetical protein A5819_003596 [Enterococcus sp. 7E2_DIV0204]OTP47266.1 hypothetical protein A5884_003641 [Enterococcus sp. 7D2_DIV0200]
MLTCTKGYVCFMKTMSDVLSYFEHSFQLLNNRYFQGFLPKTVVTVQSTLKSYGHASVQKIWSGPTEHYYEINMSADYLDRDPEDIVATLLHEMIHVYCREQEIAEISRNGTYHNKRFKLECEKRDLFVEKMDQYGWAATSATPAFQTFIKENQLDQQLPLVRTTRTKKKTASQKKQSSRKYVCPSCETIIRATSEVNVICGKCHAQFLIEN